MVEASDPLEGGELDLVQPPPGALVPDHIGFVETDYSLGQCVVVGIARFPTEGSIPASAWAIRAASVSWDRQAGPVRWQILSDPSAQLGGPTEAGDPRGW